MITFTSRSFAPFADEYAVSRLNQSRRDVRIVRMFDARVLAMKFPRQQLVLSRGGR
jgi:hypothetical protein